MKHAIIDTTKIRLYEKDNPDQPAYATRILCFGVRSCIVVVITSRLMSRPSSTLNGPCTTVWIRQSVLEVSFLIFQQVRFPLGSALHRLVITPFFNLFQITAQ